MTEIIPIRENIVKIVEEFPTNTDRTLNPYSYFHIVYSLLDNASSFLEIGYRKGLFTEVARAMGIKSVHIDISDKLLRAVSTKDNECITMDSISYLKKCKRQFDLVFQDGAKDYKTRRIEYNLLMGGILSKGGIIISDDLHYPECRKAFDYAVREYQLSPEIRKVKDKKTYELGILRNG